MLKHYLLTNLRHLWKNRLYAVISLLSLTVGLTVFCLIVLHVRHELSYNAHWADADRIYRITHKQGGTNANLPPSTGFSSQFTLNITNFIGDFVDAYVEISTVYTPLEDSDFEEALSVTLADAAFLEIFELPVTAGSMQTVMDNSGFIALDAKTAELLFGSAETAIGKTIILAGQQGFSTSPLFTAAQPAEFQVAAIYVLPEPLTQSTQFQAIVPNNDYSTRLFPSFNGIRNLNLNLWVKLKEGVAWQVVDEQLDRYLDDYLIHTRDDVDLRGGTYSELFDFKTQALGDIYFSKETVDFPEGDRSRLLTFSVVGLLVLIAGCSNVVSLGLAAAIERRREVGIRKAVGALPQSIMLQYLGEAMLLSLMAFIPTVVLVTLLHPAFANLLSVAGIPDPGLVEMAMIAAICLSVGLINGIYPALVLARVRPVLVLKSLAVRSRLQRFNLRGLLVTTQFCFSIVLLVITLGLYLQLAVTRSQPLGFNVRNLAAVSLNFALLQTRNNIADVVANGISAIPGITAALPVINLPIIYRAPPGAANVALVKTQQDSDGVSVIRVPFKPGLFDLLGIPLLAGRDLSPVTDLPQAATAESSEAPAQRIVVNRKAMEALSFGNAEAVIGQRFYLLNDNGARRSYTPAEIIGVVEDSMLTSISERPGAEYYFLEPANLNNVLFRYDDTAAVDIIAHVSEVAEEVSGVPALSVIFLENRIDEVFANEQRESRLLLMCAGLALLLSCIGLYGLVSVALKTQVKEIGVRKVLGASTFGVVKTFLLRYSIPVLVANAIAWPVAVYFVLQWIERFPYQLEKLWLLPVCLATTALVLLIAWGTVGTLTFRAASTRPVKSLRYE